MLDNYVRSHQICIKIMLLLICIVHRIGRTGRCGKTGIATTFINKMCGKCAANNNYYLAPG